MDTLRVFRVIEIHSDGTLMCRDEEDKVVEKHCEQMHAEASLFRVDSKTVAIQGTGDVYVLQPMQRVGVRR